MGEVSQEISIVQFYKKVLKRIIPARMRFCLKAIATKYKIRHMSVVREWDGNKRFGVNLIGPIRGDFGLGESCRLLARALAESKIPFVIKDFSFGTGNNEQDRSWNDRESDSTPYQVNIVHINPSEMLWAAKMLCEPMRTARYNIGFWLWEQPEFPKQWHCIFDLFDEIWTPAQFVSDAMRRCTPKPVTTVTYGLSMPGTREECDRGYFGLPDDVTLFLISYDGNSNTERKNPMGSIRAFCEAFSPEERDVGLVIKATHAGKEDLERFRECLAEYPNVFVLTDNYSKAEFNSLVKCVDVYVSLHRAEGFGLVMAEAMQLGTAVIATDWSANTEFMNPEVACMVPARVVKLDRDVPPYPKESHWAQPDEKCAAEYMRRLYEDSTYRERLCCAAQEYLKAEFSPQKAAERIEKRLAELFEEGFSK